MYVKVAHIFRIGPYDYITSCLLDITESVKLYSYSLLHVFVKQTQALRILCENTYSHTS